MKNIPDINELLEGMRIKILALCIYKLIPLFGDILEKLFQRYAFKEY